MSTPPADSVDPKLLEILVCPLTKGPLEYDAEKQELISRAAKLAYPIRDGIPIMLPEEARRLELTLVIVREDGPPSHRRRCKVPPRRRLLDASAVAGHDTGCKRGS